MRRRKFILIILLLLTAIIASLAVPKAKYVGTNFIPGLEIPNTFAEWIGRDVSEVLNVSAANTNFNFVNEALAYEYVNSTGQNLLFILLDAGNFHHPNVCFTGAGYQIRELPPKEFHLKDGTLKAHTLFTQRGSESFLSLYWIIIDKNIAHEWIEQKIKQLFYSLFNKKRIGLMVRIDVPSQEDGIHDASTLAAKFIRDLSEELRTEQADYIFGKGESPS